MYVSKKWAGRWSNSGQTNDLISPARLCEFGSPQSSCPLHLQVLPGAAMGALFAVCNREVCQMSSFLARKCLDLPTFIVVGACRDDDVIKLE